MGTDRASQWRDEHVISGESVCRQAQSTAALQKTAATRQ